MASLGSRESYEDLLQSLHSEKFMNEDGDEISAEEFFGFKLPSSFSDVPSNKRKQLVKEITDKLDDADSDDMFGSEGWRHYFGFEDK